MHLAKGTSVNRNSAVRPASSSLRGLFARLRRDARGNTLVMVAISLLPLLAMIGSGIDMGRGYLAQSRLQQACDAAALAGRRAMTAGVLDDTVRTEAEKFFRFNFPTGTVDVEGSAAFQSKGFKPVIGSAANSTVTVSATTTLPTTVMKIFGFNTLPLSVTCFAKQDFVNTDIALVLDTTGSMLDDVNNNAVNGGSTSKIAGLRNAVMALYDQLAPVQTQLEAAGLRLRYSIVPYSSTVNVGRLVRAQNASYIASDDVLYQTRQPQYDVTNTTATTSTPNVTQAACNNLGGNWRLTNLFTWPWLGTCTYTAETGEQTRTFNGKYNYGQFPVDVSKFVASTATGTVLDPTSGTNESVPGWSGCIEERKTVSTIGSTSGYSIPSGAYDLNIDFIPNSDDTRWVPHWPQMIWYRQTGLYNRDSSYNNVRMTVRDTTASFYACPTEARRLKSWTRAELKAYVDGLRAIGGTYHDIGMIWGARFLSSTGIFSGDNPDTFGNMPVSKFIIFLTDGQMAPNADSYSSYGVEYMDQRVTGSSSATNQKANHIARMKMICQAAKTKSISIWVIAFATGLDASLTECASNPGQASTSSSQGELIAKFTEIGKNIGALRLSQ
jgi:Flp pilus assembly protein TadG